MINVNQITSMLAKMPDTALQKYAAMNKNDPYIMALAVSESTRRKEMRAGAQAQQGQMQQPKVADQAVASMAAPMPEDQGIAQLPAGNMNFADGGIVAFADGGDIPRYQAGGRTSVLAGTAYEIPGMTLPATSFIPQAGKGQDETPWLRRVYNDAQAQGLAYQVEQARARIAAGYGTSADRAILAQAEAAATEKASVPPTEVAANAPAVNRSLLNTAEQRAVPTVGAKTTEGKAAPAPTAAPAAGFASYDAAKAGLQDLYKTPESFNQYEQARKDQAGAGVGIAQEAASRTQDFYDKLGEFGLKQEERLKEREGKLEKDTAQNKGLAIFEAGLAMMSGTSANAFENIGKGALAGVANYKKGLAALNDRKDRLDDAYNQLETARYSDKKDRFQQIEAAQKNVDAAKLGIYQATTDIAAKRTDLDSKQATALADATVKSVEAQRDRQSRESIAAAPGDTQKMYMALGGGDLKKGFEVAKQMEAANKKDIMTQYTEWLKANPTLAMDPNKAMAEFMKQSLIMGGIGTPQLSSKPTGQVEGKLK